MDLYNLREWNVGIDAWFDAGSGAAGQNPAPYTYYGTGFYVRQLCWST